MFHMFDEVKVPCEFFKIIHSFRSRKCPSSPSASSSAFFATLKLLKESSVILCNSPEQQPSKYHLYISPIYT